MSLALSGAPAESPASQPVRVDRGGLLHSGVLAKAGG